MPSADSGLVVVDKPTGITSHGVVGRLRRELGTRKVGHAGTLDPMATGVLVAGVNRATRLLGHLALHDKEYRATIRLGQATVTDDAEGEVVSSADASSVSNQDIAREIARLRGDILQVPSAVSAIKVNGQRSYARVRAGEDVTLAARPVTVSAFDVLDIVEGDRVRDISVHVECTSGTYVRALARDLGAALGVGGHLTALRRTRVGPFSLADVGETTTLLAMGEVARRCFACVVVDEPTARAISYGQKVAVELPAETTALLDCRDELLALYRRTAEGGRAACVLVEPPQAKENVRG